MTDTDVAVKLEGHEHEIKSLKHRMDDQEAQSKTIQDLVISVQKLAINMEAMLKEQGAQGVRLAKLEAEPADTWKRVKIKALDTAVGLIGGAIVTGAVIMAAQYIH